MYSYSSVTVNPTVDIGIDTLNQMVINDAANEQMRLIALEPPLAFSSMDNNVGTSSTTPSPDTSTNALYFAKNTTTGVSLNVDNVINSPLSIQVTVDRPGIYRFYVIALMSSGAGDCIPSFQITDTDSDIVQEIGGYITSGTQSSTTGHFYTPSILFADRWLYGGKTYKFTVTTGLLGTNSDIAYINAYKFPPTIAYFWVQGYNGTGQQIETPDITIPSFGIDIPVLEIPTLTIPAIPDPAFPDFPEIPDVQVPDFAFNDGSGFDGNFDIPDFDPEFPFGEWSNFEETFNKGTSAGLGPDLPWQQIDWDIASRIPGDFDASPVYSFGTNSNQMGSVQPVRWSVASGNHSNYESEGGGYVTTSFPLAPGTGWFVESTIGNVNLLAFFHTLILYGPYAPTSATSIPDESEVALGKLSGIEFSVFNSYWNGGTGLGNIDVDITPTSGDILRVEIFRYESTGENDDRLRGKVFINNSNIYYAHAPDDLLVFSNNMPITFPGFDGSVRFGAAIQEIQGVAGYTFKNGIDNFRIGRITEFSS